MQILTNQSTHLLFEVDILLQSIYQKDVNLNKVLLSGNERPLSL